MGYYDQEELSNLVGKKVTEIWWSEDLLTFRCGEELLTFRVDGDCCSYSYFYDFYGVRNLLDNGAITEVAEHELAPGDPGYHTDDDENDYGCTEVYGYRFTTEHPLFGPVTSVLSFRNRSNGYYGGWMSLSSQGKISKDQRQVFDDVIGG